jgi:glutathione synthase/RimK-type ligase-like ATP-grasp enzyme
MILIYGRMDDPPLSSAVEALQEAGAPYVLIEQSALDREELCVTVGPRGIDGTLVVGGQEVPLESIRSIYARPLEAPASRWDQAGVAHARTVHEQLVEWLDVSPALVVNRPRAMQANASKVLQIQLIGEAGFLVPETLVTSDEAEAREFWRQHRRLVYKSVSGVRSIVQELDERSAKRLGQLAALPVQLQQYVPGVDVRVHVVGDRAYAAEIEGAGIDYRYSAHHGREATLRAVELPAELEERCIGLSRCMELPLSGIDLRRRPDGAYVCFEVNPMPAYSYFESHTGLPIGRALAELLVTGPTGHIEVGDVTGDRESDAARRHDRGAAAASTAGRL